MNGYDQMYHFWFYSAVSYYDGHAIATFGNWFHEKRIPRKIHISFTYPSYHHPISIVGFDVRIPGGNNGIGVSKQDYDLGLAGVEFGSKLRNSELTISKIGDWIRNNLGGM